jgi:hypothetical protein
MRIFGCVWLGAAMAVSIGCGDDVVTVDASPDAGVASDAMVDAPPDAPEPIPDGATLCDSDSDCVDDIDCTLDICDERGFCRNPAQTSRCDDGVFCNGVEQCDIGMGGCVPGPPRSCSDNDVCTIDGCNEAMQVCTHEPRDFDEDGEADFRCEGGTDCDDFDPTRGSMVAEVCGDSIDNDCDMMVDELDCGRPQHDSCSDPLDVSGGGSFVLNNEGAVGDYALTCGGAGRRDVVLRLELEEPQDLSVTADGASVTWVGVRESCEDQATELECSSGIPTRVRARALEPGVYFIIIADAGAGEIGVEVELSDPVPPPENETCETALDVSEGGRFEGTFVDVDDDLTTACGGTAAPELVYSFTLEEPQDVVLSANADTGDDLDISIRNTCGDETSSLRCIRGSPAATRLYSLEAGTYFFIVEGPSFREVDFALDVSFLPPSEAPEGDTCQGAIPLTLGELASGSLSDKQDDIPVDCGFFYRDAVYRFTIEERSDVTIELDGGGTFMNFSLRQACADPATELRCTSGRPALTSLVYLEPGSYDVIVEAPQGTGFSLQVDATPSTEEPVDVSNENEGCGTAWPVPADGGLFRGATEAMAGDLETRDTCGSMAAAADAVFELELTEDRRVVATTAGSEFDTVLHLHQGTCTSAMELFCDDDGGPDGRTSRVAEVLAPGTWFIVVDGWGSSQSGAYTLDIDVSAP